MTDRWLSALYLVLAIGMSGFADERAHLGLFWATAVLMAGCALVLLVRGRLSLQAIVLIGLGARLAVFWMPPGLSDDAYRYLWDGYLQHAGINPYAWPPVALEAWHHLDLYTEMNSARFYSVYPPLSQMLFWVATPGDPQNWMWGWYIWKAICFACEAGTLWLLRSTSKQALLLYALHPLVVIELVGQAHTEAIMVLGLVAASYAVRRGALVWAGVALAAAVMTKLFPVLLFPFLVRSRQDVLRLVPGLLLCLVAAALYWTPTYLENMLESLRLYAQYFEFNAGFYYAVKGALQALTDGDWSKQIGPVFALLFAVVWATTVVHHFYRPLSFARYAYVVLGAFLVLSTTVHPWYLTAVLAIIPFAGATGWAWQALALASLGTYLLYVDGPYFSIVMLGWLAWLTLLLTPLWTSRRHFRAS